ncbi:MAG: hypothetical protein AVDCRST_MAG19-2663 [uncultured Thermomicrobiales bacterium]|uniref:Uncharacterized protein n=1 Tax=uncultured Thermomicrobiales bacterium TaxID=1645740 RepID=A0A6J4VBT2_9BACT|nr:MAG: hypothetical protein AVDCRST_MAG19-2663 [uncultured Thermomicrobiales bacterium]
MLLGRPTARLALGVILALLGGLWILQGLDVLGQDGGMNGRGEWTLIGAVALVAGLALAASALRGRRRL